MLISSPQSRILLRFTLLLDPSPNQLPTLVILPPLSPPLMAFHSLFFDTDRLLRFSVKVGIPEFLTGIGKGVESHVAKLDSEIGDFQKLLVTRTLKLKKLGIPCKHVIIFILYSLSLFCLSFLCIVICYRVCLREGIKSDVYNRNFFSLVYTLDMCW